jgi:hypothetical protein
MHGDYFIRTQSTSDHKGHEDEDLTKPRFNDLTAMFEWTNLLGLIVSTGTLSILSKTYYPKAYYYTKPIPIMILLSPLFNLDLVMRLFSNVSFHTFLYTFIVSGLIFGLIGDVLLLFPSLFLQVRPRFNFFKIGDESPKTQRTLTSTR